MLLTLEQQHTLAMRDQYALMGVIYDKATQRFLIRHGLCEPIDQRPTLQYIELTERLRSETGKP